MVKPPQNLKKIESFQQIIEALLGPDGCPWDKSQTHESLMRFAQEEVQELAEAVDSGCYKSICDELGDVLLQVFLHAEIAHINNKFSLEDVVESISSKMIRRHPHVFTDLKVTDLDEVWKNWDQIKKDEKSDRPPSFNIPKGLSALIQSHKIGDKTHKLQFDWSTPDQVISKIEEELQELKEAYASQSKKEIVHELGDLLFSTAQLARHLDFDAETALRQTNTRFENRFFKMLEVGQISKEEFGALNDSQKEDLWSKVKSIEKIQ